MVVAFYYADSSALVKRHMVEAGATWFRELCTSPATVIITSQLSAVEVVSALNRRVREGTLSSDDYPTLRDDFLALLRHSYRVVPITQLLLARARALLELHPLRSYDALHLASALMAHDQLNQAGLPSLTLLAADRRLLQAAQAEDLPVDDLEAHP